MRSLCSLQFRDAELAYLRSMRFIKSDFIDFLGLFRLNEKYINIIPQPSGELEIRIQGPWLHTILFEIPVLAIVNEVYFRNTQKRPDLDEGRRRLEIKIAQLQEAGLGDLKIADYGTRRRFSKDWHEEVLRTLNARLGAVTSPPSSSQPGGRLPQLAGTSNVLYAMKLGLIPLGTMAHEYLQACQALGPRLRDSQIFGFESWAREYRGDLGIALSDVYGMSAFLRDFDLYFCKLFDGARHDSGDPFQWGERMIAHYLANRVDPRTKTLIFSDGLTVPRTIELYQQFRGRCQLAFGIGTNLTNDLGYEPLQIVIKMIRCNDQPVAKLSDTRRRTCARTRNTWPTCARCSRSSSLPPDAGSRGPPRGLALLRYGPMKNRCVSWRPWCRCSLPGRPWPRISTAARCRRCGACRSRASCSRSR